MDAALGVVLEINEVVWRRFKRDLEGVTPDEIDWRPLSEANSINLILRHLRIDAAWHVSRIEQGEEGPPEEAGHGQRPESVPLEFDRNLKELDDLCTRFIGALGRTTLTGLERQTALAYEDSPQGPAPAHMLGFHLALHLAGHGGQIRTLRNPYRKTRGEPARFFPDNPTFPA